MILHLINKQLFLIIVFVITILSNFAQTIYTTSFSAGHGWTLNNYNNLNTTVEGDSPNPFYVSDVESGKGVGNRGGTLCGNSTLHVGSITLGDMGAAYDGGGCTNLGFGPCASCFTNGLYCVTTDRSAISPNVNTTGFSVMTLQFSYIHSGTALLDNAEVIYSIDGGTTWTLLTNLPKTTCCLGLASCILGCVNVACSGSTQGKWTLFSNTLPISCNNITNLRVGIRWYNDDVSTSATDPSVAIDDVLIYSGVLPIEYSFLHSKASANGVDLSWQTYNEKNNKGFDIERSNDALHFIKVLDVNAKGPNYYSVTDESANLNTLYYYRFKQKDFNGDFKYSNTTSILINDDDVLKVYPNPATNQLNFLIKLKNILTYKIEIYNAHGKTIYTSTQTKSTENNDEFTLNTSLYTNGIYGYTFTIGTKTIMGKFIIQN